MESDHFDALARTLTSVRSRRQALVAILGGALGMVLGATAIEETEAKKKKPCPACKKRKKGKCKANKPDGTACPGGTCQGGSCCVPESAAATCARAACGTVRTNTCGQAVICSCPAGQDCLSNGSCGITCTASSQCPHGCTGCGFASTEGPSHCIAPITGCESVPQSCTSTAECPLGQHCQGIKCDLSGQLVNRCIPMCTG